MDESYNGKKLANNQINNHKNNYSYQYQHTSNGMNGEGVHANRNGKAVYSELSNGHGENYRYILEKISIEKFYASFVYVLTFKSIFR